MLPRFHVGVVGFGVAVGVFVGKSAKAVTEFVHHNRGKLGVVGSGEGVVVVDSAAAIFVGVGKDDDVLVEHSGNGVVNAFHARGGEIAVAIECAEVRAESGVAPFAQAGYAQAAVARRGEHSHDVELGAPAAEWLVGEQGVAGGFGIAVEQVALGLRIAFAQNHHVDAAFNAAAFVHIAIVEFGVACDFAYENVGRVYFVGVCCGGF